MFYYIKCWHTIGMERCMSILNWKAGQLIASWRLLVQRIQPWTLTGSYVNNFSYLTQGHMLWKSIYVAFCYDLNVKTLCGFEVFNCELEYIRKKIEIDFHPDID